MQDGGGRREINFSINSFNRGVPDTINSNNDDQQDIQKKNAYSNNSSFVESKKDSSPVIADLEVEHNNTGDFANKVNKIDQFDSRSSNKVVFNDFTNNSKIQDHNVASNKTSSNNIVSNQGLKPKRSYSSNSANLGLDHSKYKFSTKSSDIERIKTELNVFRKSARSGSLNGNGIESLMKAIDSKPVFKSKSIRKTVLLALAMFGFAILISIWIILLDGKPLF
jgi:hypothetical protein